MLYAQGDSPPVILIILPGTIVQLVENYLVESIIIYIFAVNSIHLNGSAYEKKIILFTDNSTPIDG